jgi:hypothetical protein
MPQAVRPVKLKAKVRAPVSSPRASVSTSTNAGAALVPVDKPLTELQIKFLRHYSQGETVATAMHLAGYNDQPSYGYRILKMPNALALLGRFQEEYRQASQMTKKKVIDMQLEAYEMSKLMAEPSSMVAAAREIGKLCGFYEPKRVEISLTGGSARKQLETLSSEDLEALIAKAEQQAAGELTLLEQVDGE